MENLRTLVYNAFDSDPTPIADFLQWQAEQHNLPSRLHLLDVGCGPGRMFGEYARLGWTADALEVDPYFCAEAEKAASTSDAFSVECGGFEEIHAVESYHLIAAINSPFAYLLTHEAQVSALQHCHRALRAGGLLLLDVPNLLWFLRNERAPIVRTAQANGYQIRFLELHEYDLHDARFVQTNEYHVSGAHLAQPFTFRATHTHRITTPPDLLRLLHQSGFDQIQTYGSYAARAPQRLDGKNMLITARKTLL